jgi:hypothetical protein
MLGYEARERAFSLLWKGRPAKEVRDAVRDATGEEVGVDDVKAIARKVEAVRRRKTPRDVRLKAFHQFAMEIAPYHYSPESIAASLAVNRFNTSVDHVLPKLLSHRKISEVERQIGKPRTWLYTDAKRLAPKHFTMASLARALARTGRYERDWMLVYNHIWQRDWTPEIIRLLKQRPDVRPELRREAFRRAAGENSINSLWKSVRKMPKFGAVSMNTLRGMLYGMEAELRPRLAGKPKLRMKNVVRDAKPILGRHPSFESAAKEMEKWGKYRGYGYRTIVNHFLNSPDRPKLEKMLKPSPWENLVDDALRIAPRHSARIGIASELAQKHGYGFSPTHIRWMLVNHPRWPEIRRRMKPGGRA